MREASFRVGEDDDLFWVALGRHVDLKQAEQQSDRTQSKTSSSPTPPAPRANPWGPPSSPLGLLTLFFFGGGVSCELAGLARGDSGCWGGLLQVTATSRGTSTALEKDGDMLMEQWKQSWDRGAALTCPGLGQPSGGCLGSPPPPPSSSSGSW